MKYAFVALALAAAVQAQTREDIPSCALPCLDDAISSQSSCKTTDIPCVCKNFDKIRGAATSCILEKCGADTALKDVLPAAQALCAGGSSGGSSSAAAATTTAAVTTTVAVTSTPAAVTSTPIKTVSSVVSAPVSTVKSAVSTVKSAVPTVVQTSHAGSATTSPTPVAAGAAAMGSIGAVAAFFLAALAL